MSSMDQANPAVLAQQLLAATNNLSDEAAGRAYRQILAQLPKEEAAQLNALAMTQVAEDQRRSLASGLKQAHQNPASPFDGYDQDDDEIAATPQVLGRISAQAAQQDPALVNNLLGGDNSGLGGQIGKAALAALAALLIRQFLQGQGQQAPTGGAPGQMSGGGIDLGAILGPILAGAGGAAAGGGGGFGGAGQQAPAGGLDLGSILGSILSSAGQQPSAGGSYGGASQQAPAGGLDLGSILGSILSSAGQQAPAGGGVAGSGQQAPAGGIDLGSILGSILGGSGAGSSHQKG